MPSAADIVKEMKKSKKGMEVSLLNEDTSPCVVNEFISTGCLALDSIMGGGLPVGRLVEFYGDPSSGKSLIAAQIAATAQYQGYIVAYADTETAVSIDMMKVVGVNVDDLIYAAPDTIEETFEFMETAIAAKKKIDPNNKLVLMWDSIAASSTKAELGKDYGETGYLNHARVMSQGLRKLKGQFADNSVAALFLNQTRTKIGVMFGDKTATFGGKAVEFYSSIRVFLDLASKIKRAEGRKKKIIGMHTKAVCTKNKVAMPFQEAMLPVYFGSGIDDAGASQLWLKDNGYVENGVFHFGKEDLKFKGMTEWRKLYDEHYDDIEWIIMDYEDEDDTDN